jgi:hypothetical protein
MPSITTPVTVVDQPYNTSGNGGRKLVRLSNGWLVAAAKTTDGTRVYLYKSVDNGNTWSQLCFANGSFDNFALASKDTTVYLIGTRADASAVQFREFDATTVANTDVPLTSYVDTGQSSFGPGASLAIAPDGTLHAAWASKNSTYPNSFNIRYSKSTDEGQTWATPTQITKYSVSGAVGYSNPTIVVKNADPFIIVEASMASRPIVVFSPSLTGMLWDSTAAWWNTVIFAPSSSAYPALSPCSLVKKYGSNVGRIFVGWHGRDATDNTKQNVRVAYSDDGAVTWTIIGKITTGNTVDRKNVSLAEDQNGNVYATYEDDGTIKFQVCPDGTTTFGDLTSIETGTNPSALESGSFTAVPVVYQTATSVRFHGSFNNLPILTLTSPTNNQVLSEGNALPMAGEVSDADNGNVITVKLQINNGPIRAIASGISDGSTPINFARTTLTYHNKRLWDGVTDISGADLAENVDHTLKIWAEDDQGGKSAEVTRKFRVIWNRPPTISGTDTDLGVISVAPSQTYTVSDPEGQSFTITEYLDGEVLRTFSGVAGQEYTVTIPTDKWLRTSLAQHTLKVRATDSAGQFSERTYTFTRTDDRIVFELDEPFLTDAKANRILVTLDAVIPPGASYIVEACNNAFDAQPTWEDVTGPVSAGRGYIFTNETKTAANWGVSIRFTFLKGTATEKILINGFGGAFD